MLTPIDGEVTCAARLPRDRVMPIKAEQRPVEAARCSRTQIQTDRTRLVLKFDELPFLHVAAKPPDLPVQDPGMQSKLRFSPRRPTA
jgi:hypothetical protein